MNFYFCEACGKRVTEKDIEAGSARDKQLKGVYCTTCSSGVLTMEALPLTDAQARSILGKPEAPKRKSSNAKTSKAGLKTRRSRSATAIDAPPAHRPEADPSIQGESTRSTRTSAVFWSAAAATAVALAVLVATRGNGTPEKLASPALPDVALKSHPGGSTPAPMPPKAAWNSGNLAQVPAPREIREESKDPRALKAFEKMILFEGLAEGDREEKIRRLEEFLSGHVGTRAASQARDVLVQLKRSPALPTATLVLDAPWPPLGPAPALVSPALPVPDPPLSDPLQAARTAFAVYCDEFWVLLRKGDRKAIIERLERAERDPALASLKAELSSDRKILTWLDDLDAAIPKGVEKLKDAETFELRRLRGDSFQVGRSALFQVTDFKAGKLDLTTKGATLPVALSDLDPETLVRLGELGLGESGPEGVRRAFGRMLEMGRKDAVSESAVRKALEKARVKGAPEEDVAYLLSRLVAAQGGAKEAFVEELLVCFEKAFAAQSWAEAERIGVSLLADHGTSAAVRKRKDLQDQVARSARKGAPFRDYLLTLQQGQPVPEAGVEKYAGTRDAELYGHENEKDLWIGPQQMFEGGNGNGIGGVRHFLIGFVLFENEGGVLHDSTQILEAKFHLYKSNAEAPFVELRRIRKSWNHLEATWISASKGVRWDTPAGDVAEKVSASVQAQGGAEWLVFDLTESLMESQKERKNFGWKISCVVKAGAPWGNSVFFTGSYNEKDPSLRPKLVLKVRCPRLSGDKK